MRITPTTLVFLSFIVGVVSFLDTTFRLFFLYTSETPYPPSTILKPLFFVLQTVFLLIFIKKLRFSKLAGSLNREIRILLVFQTLLITALLTLYSGNVLSNVFSYTLPGQYVGLAEFVLFWLGPALSSFWIAASVFRKQRETLSFVFLIVGFAFLAKPLEELYFWGQTYFNLALPYPVVVVGMLGPLLLMAVALFFSLIVVVHKFKLRIKNFSILYNPYFLAACFAVVLPAVLVGVNRGLGNLIIRAVVYWGLSYTGFDWYSVSLLLVSLVVYVYIVRKLGSKLDNSLASNLIKLGCLSFVWNGVAIIVFGYSSIPGNLLSLDAIALGLMLRWAISKET